MRVYEKMFEKFSSQFINERNIWSNTFFEIFKQGDKNVKFKTLSAVVDVFGFSGMESEQRVAAHEMNGFLSSLTIKEYFHLENVYRRWDYGWEKIKRQSRYWKADNIYTNIKKIKDEKEKRQLWILGSMNADGHVRQRCLMNLAEYENSLPFLLLRLNDWVREIRSDAYFLTEKRIDCAQTEELLLALPVFEKLSNSKRKGSEMYDTICDRFNARFEQVLPKLNFEEIDKYDRAVRNSFFRALNQRNLFDKEKLCELLSKIKGSYESRMVIHALVKYHGMNEQEFYKYLQSNNSIVRRYVIEQWSAKHGIWENAHQFLMDSAKGVRANVQYLIQKYTELDMSEYYLQYLSSNKKKIAIEGLGEVGGKEVVDYLSPYLDDKDWTVQRKALKSIGNILKDKGSTIYLHFLQNDNIALVKEAYQQCRKWYVIIGRTTIEELYENSEDEQKQCYYMLLLEREPLWDCMVFYLKLYGRVSGKLQDIINRSIYHRPMFQRITKDKGQKIFEALEQNKEFLPKSLYKEITFDLEKLLLF